MCRAARRGRWHVLETAGASPKRGGLGLGVGELHAEDSDDKVRRARWTMRAGGGEAADLDGGARCGRLTRG